MKENGKGNEQMDIASNVKQNTDKHGCHKAIYSLLGNGEKMICLADDLSLEKGEFQSVSDMREYLYETLSRQKEKDGFYGLYILDSVYQPIELVWKFYFLS